MSSCAASSSDAVDAVLDAAGIDAALRNEYGLPP
jgi:hypothetical protein